MFLDVFCHCFGVFECFFCRAPTEGCFRVESAIKRRDLPQGTDTGCNHQNQFLETTFEHGAS